MTLGKNFNAKLKSRRASALLLVFALVSVLTYLIFTTLKVVMTDVDFASASKKAFRCRCLAESGIAVAMNPAVKEFDTEILNQRFGEGEEAGYESFAASINGEGGKININTLLNSQNPDKDLLLHLLEHWGLEEEERVDLVDTLIDWVDTDDGRLEHGLEKEDYEKMGYLGFPFDRPFYSLEELKLVPGWNAVTSRKSNWRDYFTIYSQGKVDLNEAPADLIEVVCCTTPEAAQEFVESRYGPDKIENTEDDVKYQSFGEAELQTLVNAGSGPWREDISIIARRVTGNDTTTRIESIGQVGDFRKRIVVVVRSREGNPQILMREEVPLFESAPPPANP